MHTIPALEIKRRGVIALEVAIQSGPVHIIKNNQPVCVVLREEEYAALLGNKKESKMSLWNLLQHRPRQGKRSKKSIDQQIKKEREQWGE